MTTSQSTKSVVGVRHEGIPEGEIETINGVETYISTPSTKYPEHKALLFLTNVFGIPLKENKLLADDFARNGFKTVVPDLFNGDPVSAEANDKGEFDLQTWFHIHNRAQTRQPVDKVISGLKEQGITSFAAIGFCFGGRTAFDLAFDKAVKAVVVNHPSLLENPADLERYFAHSKAPLFINTCDDEYFPIDFQAKADEIFGGKFEPGYKRVFWPGCEHGFSVRCDLRDERSKAGKEGAFKAAIEWLREHTS
ncbi:alpha beta-hydrolase [Coniophora puteana RWD-64-598 SS2]|uniref:Alpha beta-hydrolase n=1 Tax=Coniophora puteana (strain RWD-64-598) TaxID=741705 RepID=A0A5M3MJA5_CONPW|nr:alpha beta-hydrolase [Coniophora puteana RWD-64-598 SS2]EIW79010.1 alpha beta-hydrolase [Coniophora puteana RWD-64-598 SS2]